MSTSTKKIVIRSTIWSGIERFAAQGISFLVMIIMARMLTPKDYGLVGMLTVFIAICQALVDGGFSQALIHKQDRTETDNSTVFYFNIVISFILYGILYLSAPIIADFYNEPILVDLTRIISLSIIINSFVIVQRALFTINLNFKIQAKTSICSSFISGTVGIIYAYNNYGVWSIVIYQLTNFGLNVILLWIFSKWRPQLLYSWKSFNLLFKYGINLAITAVLSSIYDNLLLIIIGKIYRPAELGYYTRAFQFAYFPSSNITQITQRVIFPVLCKVQNDITTLSKQFIILLKAVSFIVLPLMFGLIGVSDSLVITLLGDKWDKAIPILQILCMSLMWYPLQSLNICLLQVKGRTDVVLKLDIIKKIIGVGCICIFFKFGVLALCIGNFISTIFAISLHLHYTKKIVGLQPSLQLKSISTILIGSVLVCIFAFLTSSILENNIVGLLGGIITATCVFVVYNYLVDRENSNRIKKIIKDCIK